MTVRSPAPRARATPVYVRNSPGSPITEELYLLAALEAVAHTETELRFAFGTPSLELVAQLQNAWFLEEVKLLAGEADWTAWHGGAIALTLPEPDPQEALAAEAALYDAWHAAETGKIQRQQAAINAAGVKDLVLPLPEHRYQSGWHKTNGYMWSLGDYLGTPVGVPPMALPPYGELPRKREREYLRQFQKAGLTRRGFLIYDLEAESNPFALLGAMGSSFGETNWVSVGEVGSALGVTADAVPVDALIALCGHPNAWFAVGPVGKLTTAAWAAGLPNILELYSGANPSWDGTQGPNALRIERDRVPAEQFGTALAQAAQLLVARAR